MIIADVLSFTIFDSNNTFIKSMNQNDISLKSQFILESLANKDPGLIFNLAHESGNKVTGIVWMTSYIRHNVERFGNYTSIDIVHSFICNAKEFCYISPLL